VAENTPRPQAGRRWIADLYGQSMSPPRGLQPVAGPSADQNLGLDLHRHTVRQTGDANRDPRMPPYLAEDLDDKVR
jgi:hypothetical protein